MTKRQEPTKSEELLPAVDFREIPINSDDGNVSDAFELFARDFFVALGFRIVEGPARGPDLGRDLIVEEALPGQFMTEPFRWIVSAKHYAHSGRSVYFNQEVNPKGRADSARAKGFLGFYSTIAHIGLRNGLAGFSDSLRIEILDRARIEAHILRPELDDLFRRYFPNSWNRWRANEQRRLLISAESEPHRPDDSVEIDISPVLESIHAQTRFRDPRFERIMTAAIIADDVREHRFQVLKRFVTFHPSVWRYILVFLRDDPPDEKKLAAAITKMRDPFVLRNLISLAGMLELNGCANAVCQQTLHCTKYDGELAARGYDFGISPFAEVARRSLSNLGATIVPLLDQYRTTAKEQRRWKAKAIFEQARTSILRRPAP